jgi:hypothetical protein
MFMTRTLHRKVESGQRLVATDITDLTFFPKGTILIFSSEAWNATSTEFKDIWKICNGQYGTPNLVDKFLRGAESSDFTTGGGADSQRFSIGTENLPDHTHTFTGVHVKDTLLNVAGPNTPAGVTVQSGGDNIFTCTPQNSWNARGGDCYGTKIDFSYTPNGAVTGGGQAKPDQITVNTVPSYYSIIYIMKII